MFTWRRVIHALKCSAGEEALRAYTDLRKRGGGAKCSIPNLGPQAGGHYLNLALPLLHFSSGVLEALNRLLIAH